MADKGSGRRGPLARLSSAWETVQPGVADAANSAMRQGKEWYKFRNMGDGDVFKHTYLTDPSSSIRLLKIEPGHQSDILRVSLHVANFRDNPRYTALSYKWTKDSWMRDFSEAYLASSEDRARLLETLKQRFRGPTHNWSSDLFNDAEETFAEYQIKDTPKEAQKTIICDGKKFDIGPNLYNALSQLRAAPQGEFYWADAICLLQSESDEKKAQLRIMGEIYRAAERVAIWLGTCPIYISPGIKRLLSTGMSSVLPYYHESAELQQPDFQEKSWDIDNVMLMASVYYLLSRGWYTRLWVLQETLLAKDTIFLLGEHQISQSTILATINWNASGLLEGEDIMSGTEELRCHYECLAQYFIPHWADEDNHESSHLQKLHDDYGVMGNWFLLFYFNLKYIPTVMLSPREMFRQGAKWTLEQFLVACNSRDWGVLEDFVYGGLSLIRPESLKINQLIQAEGLSLPPLPPRPGAEYGNLAQERHQKGRLWSSLDERLDAKAPELFLNLSACLLSHPQQAGLLSVAALFRNPRSKLPSWIPNPESPRSQSGETFAMQKGMTTFTACTELAIKPEISADGKTLSLDAAELDVVEHKGPITMLMTSYEVILEYLEFAAKLPEKDRLTGNSGIVALAHALIGGVWGSQHPPPQEAVDGFCHGLGESIRDYVSEQVNNEQKGEGEHRRPRHTRHWFATNSKHSNTATTERPSAEKRAQIIQAYQGLMELYPEHPWPTIGGKSMDDKKLRLFGRFFAAHNLAVFIGERRPFITRGGCVGLGPRYLKEDDVIMLVSGFYVPYIFTSVDENLRRKAERILGKIRNIDATSNNSIVGNAPHSSGLQNNPGAENMDQRRKLNAELEDIQDRMGTADSWILVGEAYVGGVMKGEAVQDNREMFKRIDIV